MARELSEEEITKLLAMPEAEASKWIDASIPGFLDAVEAKKALIRRRQYPADVPIPGFDGSALAGLGAGVGVTAVTAARMAELIKGSTTTYEAVLNPNEIRGRLQAVLGQEFTVRVNPDGDVIIAGNDRGLIEFCRVHVAVNGDKTAVIVSGLNLDGAKRGVGDVFDGLLGLGKRALGGSNVVEGALDILGGAVETAGQAGSNLLTANTIADTLEKYGAQMERQTAEVARRASVEKNEAMERERKKNNCSFCGSPRTLGEACPKCGATE